MSNLCELYQEIIIDHNQFPKHQGIIDEASHFAEGYNETCGDEIRIYLVIKENKIHQIQFTAQGCAISKASASMMCEKLCSMDLMEALEFSKKMQQYLSSGENSFTSETFFREDELGDLLALEGVKNFPMRIKCATLAWHTFDRASESPVKSN